MLNLEGMDYRNLLYLVVKCNESRLNCLHNKSFRFFFFIVVISCKNWMMNLCAGDEINSAVLAA